MLYVNFISVCICLSVEQKQTSSMTNKDIKERDGYDSPFYKQPFHCVLFHQVKILL